MDAIRLLLTVTAALIFFSDKTLHAQETFPMRQLTSDAAQEGFPSWSPDGETIVYSLGDRESPSRTGLWKIPAAGGEPWQLTDFIGEHPDWSLDGQYIVFDADSGNSIKLVSAHGGHPVRVVPGSIPVFRGGNPNWSPDGSRIAFREGSNLWVLDIRTGEATIAFTREGTYPIPGCWSPDGEHVLVTVRDIESYESGIYSVPSSGVGEAREVTFEGDLIYRYLDLSPDGTLLALVGCVERACDLWVGSAAGGKLIQLTSHPALDGTPRWSPDGTRIAFTSTRDDNFNVWIMEPDVDAVRTALKVP
jgi:Tol biopolymer transport system component